MIPTREQRAQRRAWRAAAAVLIGTLLISAPSWAEPTAAEKETARSLLGAGQKKFEAGDYAGALEAWRGADDIMHVPTTGIRVGKAQERLGKLVEARDAWLEVARHPVEPGEPRAFTAARKEAVALAAAIEERIPSVTVTVSGVPQELELDVSVDGVRVPPAAALLPRKVNPGAHKLSVNAPGYLAREEEFSLGEGESRTLNVELQRDPAAAAAPATAAPATVATAPPPQTSPPPIAPGHEDYSRPIEPRHDSPGSANMFAVVSFTAGGLGVVVGGITGIMSATKTSDIKTRCEGDRCPTESEPDIDDAKTLATISNIGFGVGVLGLGLGVLALVLDDGGSAATAPPRRTARRGVSLTPVLGVGSFELRGRF
ncbi:MAG: hypothetical protein KC766_31460 [Myxococcales bacterium]|nr:hypothetical protein [Myxococcales bacterium]